MLGLQNLALYISIKICTLCLDMSNNKNHEFKKIGLSWQFLDFIDLPKMEGSILKYSKVVKF